MALPIPRNQSKNVEYWLNCKSKNCKYGWDVHLPWNKIKVKHFENLRVQCVQHVLDKHWKDGTEEQIMAQYTLDDLTCWDHDKKTQYAMPLELEFGVEVPQVTLSPSPEPEARRSRSPQRSRRSIVQEHGRSGGKEIPKSPETRRSRKSRSGGKAYRVAQFGGRYVPDLGDESDPESAQEPVPALHGPSHCGTMKLNEYQSEVLQHLRSLDEGLTHLPEQQE